MWSETSYKMVFLIKVHKWFISNFLTKAFKYITSRNASFGYVTKDSSDEYSFQFCMNSDLSELVQAWIIYVLGLFCK